LHGLVLLIAVVTATTAVTLHVRGSVSSREQAVRVLAIGPLVVPVAAAPAEPAFDLTGSGIPVVHDTKSYLVSILVINYAFL
jgi:hypothetical protein